MPNGNVHKTAGAVIGSFIYLTIQNNSKQKVDPGELILSTCVGVSTSRIPDILEPPINPNHREFYHSLAFGFLIGFIGTQAWTDFQLKRDERRIQGVQRWSLREYVDVTVILSCFSILLHLIMDGFTKKGLNII